jgi:hypothetical protein
MRDKNRDAKEGVCSARDRVVRGEAPQSGHAGKHAGGAARDQRCVIERSENGFEKRVDETSAANDWAPGRPMWEARIAATHFLTCSSAEAAARSGSGRERLRLGKANRF